MGDILKHDEGVKFPLSVILRERAYALLSMREHESVVTYEELTTAMGLDPQQDTRARHAVLRAGRLLLREQRKKLLNVRNVGYQIIKPIEQVAASKKEQQRARRWLKRGLETVTHISLENLSPVDIAQIMTEQARAAIQLAMSQRLGRAKVLPPKEQLALPSSRHLVDLFRRAPRKAG